ncbi:Uma2 family endonuclease [Nocardia sp. NPDC051030]|uniref:Uma2 family endonuclease n=1 Tax=Nocardia sp. NPDC051030 TaxID=3155162 RepID=UPI0034359561
MSWEELERLPEEIAEQIELWNGRVVWVRRGPSPHQRFMRRLANALERCAQKSMAERTELCWQVDAENNVFFGQSGKSDFMTPDFLVFQCLPSTLQDIRATDVLLVGEVLSPSNTEPDMEAKKNRYASAGIPWYWEARLDLNGPAISTIRAYALALELERGHLVEGVRPLRPANYVLAGEWSPAETDGVEFDFPFSIRIPWAELEY